MARLARKFMAHYIDVAAPEDGDELFVLLGEGIEEFKPELSAKVDKKVNILGQTDILISGYEKTCEVGTYYADPDSELYDRLMKIIEKGLVLESLRTRVVDVYLWKPEQPDGYPAAIEDAYIEVKAYGGDAAGLQIPFTLHYTGNRQKGYFETKAGIFTPAEDEE